ncbi:Tryptophan aminotransferase-related protein [Quillaja saponaria]|uniref:Tryptophan aminotransferase-related protein n=1 Tax=Quillaja saponaria TaxID=32244 RepID=A0AAD7L993_QUISA|nr:Tryptophan aminotransferase-related protein [Quillaja saponaria]
MCGTDIASAPVNKNSSLPSSNGLPSVNATRTSTPTLHPHSFINLEQGDPTVFESYWKKMGDKCTVVIKGSDLLSYMTDLSNVCWFMLPELRDAIERLHRVVGNAVTDGKYIVVGTGSTQLFQAALFALSSPDNAQPLSVVAAAPYYSEYPEEVDYLRSGLYKWAGDAHVFDKDGGAYIEVVTSPNNPDGSLREPVVKGGKGKLIHDLAYYWPHYTPINHMADYNIMNFTLSKCTGHAGSRIGWAIVKDKEVAKKMTRFIQMSSIGVSRESQRRAAKIMEVICESYENVMHMRSDKFFDHSKAVMTERWDKLKKVVEQSEVFSLENYPKSCCYFTGEITETQPAFAWLKSKNGIDDCESCLRGLKILSRGGIRFGADPKYARLSMLSREDQFNEFLRRLSNVRGISNGH